MDLSFITKRLEADYYSTKYSVAADVRLIHTNSAKYNGDNDDLTQLARLCLRELDKGANPGILQPALKHRTNAADLSQVVGDCWFDGL